MKTKNILQCFIYSAISWLGLSAFLIMSTNVYALTIGETYTITIEKVSSDGTVTSGATSLGLSTTAVADSDGKISFSFANSIPDNDSCNFMVVTLTNSSDAVERKSVVPCPTVGDTLPLGVSSVTASQADALLAGFTAAGTDDPILAVFGLTIVRSTGMSATELAEMAVIANAGINNTGGYVSYLTAEGITTTQLASYRSSIVAQLADPDAGYCKLFKDSVDASDISDPDLEAAKRGEAAAKLLSVLVSAATTAGFSQDKVLEAFNAMGGIAVPLLTSSTVLTAASKQSVNASVGGAIQKLSADKSIEKYTLSMTTLGASGADLTQFQNASSALTTAMQAAFSTFDKVFTGSETAGELTTAQTAMNTAMTAAFDTFLDSTAASGPRITTMIANIDSALGGSSGLGAGSFTFQKKDGGGTENWPTMMVIVTDWASTIKSAGGNMGYTRDGTAVPAGYLPGDARTDYSAIPYPYRALFELQEDIQILEFVRWDAQGASGGMDDDQGLEKAYGDALAGLKGNITGTTDGTTAINVKKALVRMMISPQF